MPPAGWRLIRNDFPSNCNYTDTLWMNFLRTNTNVITFLFHILICKQNNYMLCLLKKNKNCEAYSYSQWNYFQRGRIDKWRWGDLLFHYKTWCIPLEAFASNYYKCFCFFSLFSEVSFFVHSIRSFSKFYNCNLKFKCSNSAFNIVFLLIS